MADEAFSRGAARSGADALPFEDRLNKARNLRAAALKASPRPARKPSKPWEVEASPTVIVWPGPTPPAEPVEKRDFSERVKRLKAVSDRLGAVAAVAPEPEITKVPPVAVEDEHATNRRPLALLAGVGLLALSPILGGAINRTPGPAVWLADITAPLTGTETSDAAPVTQAAADPLLTAIAPLGLPRVSEESSGGLPFTGAEYSVENPALSAPRVDTASLAPTRWTDATPSVSVVGLASTSPDPNPTTIGGTLPISEAPRQMASAETGQSYPFFASPVAQPIRLTRFAPLTSPTLDLAAVIAAAPPRVTVAVASPRRLALAPSLAPYAEVAPTPPVPVALLQPRPVAAVLGDTDVAVGFSIAEEVPPTVLRVSILIPDTLDPLEADSLGLDVIAMGHELRQIRPVGVTIGDRNVRYFHEEDRASAAALAEHFGAQLRDFTSFRPAPLAGTVEVWMKGRGTPQARAAVSRRETPGPIGRILPRNGTTRPAVVIVRTAPRRESRIRGVLSALFGGSNAAEADRAARQTGGSRVPVVQAPAAPVRQKAQAVPKTRQQVTATTPARPKQGTTTNNSTGSAIAPTPIPQRPAVASTFTPSAPAPETFRPTTGGSVTNGGGETFRTSVTTSDGTRSKPEKVKTKVKTKTKSKTKSRDRDDDRRGRGRNRGRSDRD